MRNTVAPYLEGSEDRRGYHVSMMRQNRLEVFCIDIQRLYGAA